MSARLLVALAVIGALMMTNESLRHRQNMAEIAEFCGDEARVDIGVTLCRIVADPNGEELIPDKPKVRVVEWRYVGGTMDPRAIPIEVTPDSSSWWVPADDNEKRPPSGKRVWYLSTDQWEAVLHEDDSKLGQLVYGSMGAGKTRALAMWHYMRWVEHIGDRPARRAGQTAPTEARLEMVRDEMLTLFPPEWRKYRAAETTFVMCDGVRIELVSTYKQSAAQGSRLAGRNWSWCGRDELQDQVEEHSEIESRSRSARQRDGRVLFKQFATCTAKEASDWRDLRDLLLASGEWVKRTLSVFRSPLYTPEFIEQRRRSMPLREFLRRFGDPKTGEPGDLLPELATYPEWDRERNLIVFDPDWVDVTESELRIYGRNRALLGGHDPGALWDVTLLLKAYVKRQHLDAYNKGRAKPFWVVRGEINTEENTTAHHIGALLDVVRRPPWQMNLLTNDGKPNPLGRQMLLRSDPSSKKEHGTDKSIYTQFANAGVHIKPAAYNAEGDGHGKVPKDPGIEVVRTLFEQRRLLVEKHRDGTIVAKKLVHAIESQKRDVKGHAETQKKGEKDTSHWTAALRYALWAIERPRLQLLTNDETPPAQRAIEASHIEGT